VTAVETQEMAEFTMLATEAIGSLVVLEAPPTSDPSFDPAMILFDAVIQVGTGPMSRCLPQHGIHPASAAFHRRMRVDDLSSACKSALTI
jgi:hypothetical protein